MLTSSCDFSKIVLWLQRGLDFSDFEGRNWEQKSTRNRSRNGVQDGWHLGIDFWTILVHFGRQVGVENRQKIDPKRHRKSDEKKKVTKMAKSRSKTPRRAAGEPARTPGRCPPKGLANPSPPRAQNHLFHTFPHLSLPIPSLPLPFPSLPFASLVLGRLGALLSRLKIDVKIDQKIDAFQDRFLERF